MSDSKRLTSVAGAPVGDNHNVMTAGRAAHSLCRIGNCLCVDTLVPSGGYSFPTYGGETPPSRSSRNRAYWPGAGGLPAW